MVSYMLVLIVGLFQILFCFYGSEAGLYDKSDSVESLDNNTIKNSVYVNTSHLSIVEFYSSWCGHCIAFAPIWKRLAREVEAWDHVVKVRAIDCAEVQNLDTCRDFGIEGFPTVKFFDAGLTNTSDIGTKFKGEKSVRNLRHALVDKIADQRDIKNHPKFTPTRIDSIEEFLAHKTSYKLLALVFEKSNSYIGRELILDTGKFPTLEVHRVLATQDSLAEKYKVSEFPTLVILNQDGTFKHLSQTNRTRASFLEALGEIEPALIKKTETVKEKFDKEQIEIKKEEALYNGTHEVFMQDLVSGISFSLRREVAKHREIKGEALSALKDWVNLILQCTPAEIYLAKYIGYLDKWLNEPNRSNNVTSSQWLDYLESHQTFDYYLPEEIKWRGCQGSKPYYRGFPCSLWVLFHSMTVHCATSPESGLTGLQVLQRIRGFIDYFFGCRYCRDHFVEMAKNLTKEVTNNDDAIIWLWSRHNKVNARLAKDRSTDPLFPKVQFPPTDLCTDCRKASNPEHTIVTDFGYGVPETKWNKKVVLEFLKEHYGPDNIRVRDKPPFQDIEVEGHEAEFYKTYFY